MKRRASNSDSSLELLLDTMTNAFGGVLFLAILISVQLQGRVFSEVEPPDPEKNVESIELKGRRDLLLVRKEGLDKQIDYQAADVADERTTTLNAEDVAQLKELEQERRRLVSSNEGMKRQLDEASEDLKQKRKAAKQKLAELGEIEIDDSKTSRLLDELRELQAELKSERDKRTISGRLPVLRYERGLVPFSLVLRNGRVYVPRPGRKINGSDFETKPSPLGGRILIPKTTGGMTVEDFLSSNRFKGASPLLNSLKLFVWEDTFEDFQAFKTAVVESGFKYRTVLMTPSDEIVLGGRGGSRDGRVQ